MWIYTARLRDKTSNYETLQLRKRERFQFKISHTKRASYTRSTRTTALTQLKTTRYPRGVLLPLLPPKVAPGRTYGIGENRHFSSAL